MHDENRVTENHAMQGHMVTRTVAFRGIEEGCVMSHQP